MGVRTTVLAMGLAAICGMAQAATVDDIKALMEQGKFREAYDLGKSHPDQFGEPVFDFFFGVSALDAGEPGEGVLALERYVLTYPDNRNARFHLARGYYTLGEDQRARDEFQGLQAEANEADRVVIERYLDAIRARESRYLPTAGAWVEVGLGYDSNINSGVPGSSSSEIPGLGSIIQVPNSIGVKEGDWYYSYAAGVQGTRPVAPGVALYGTLAFDGRNYTQSDNDQFDQLTYGASGGLSLLSAKNLYRLGLFASQQRVFGQNYVLNYGANAQWDHQFDQFNRFSLQAMVGRHDYSDMDVYGTKDKKGGKFNSQSSIRTDDYWGISAAWTHVFGVTWQPVLGLSAAYTREENDRNRSDLSRDIYSARAHLSLTPAPRWGIGLGVSYQHSDYKANFAQIPNGSARKDHNYSLDAVVSYRFDKAWSARVEAQWNDQESNVGLFDYSRSAVAAKLRYEFN